MPAPGLASPTSTGPSWSRTSSSRPMDAGPRGVARFRYADKAGKAGSTTGRSKGRRARRSPLPDSDLTVKVEKVADFPTGEGGLSRVLGEAAIPVGMFQVKQGDGPRGRALRAWPRCRWSPTSSPTRATGGQAPAAAGLDPHDVLPDLDPKTNGRFGLVEVLAGPDGSLYYRVFGRGKEGKAELRSVGAARRRGRRSSPSAATPGCR